jgi:hypothetical protein
MSPFAAIYQYLFGFDTQTAQHLSAITSILVLLWCFVYFTYAGYRIWKGKRPMFRWVSKLVEFFKSSTPAKREANGYEFAQSALAAHLITVEELEALSYNSNDAFDKGMSRALRDIPTRKSNIRHDGADM